VSATMIDQRKVTDALLGALRASTIPVGDGYAPEGADTMQRFATLLQMNGAPGGGLYPEKTFSLEYRVRSVGVDPSKVSGRVGPRMDAEATSTTLRRILLDRATKIEGTGWRIVGRRWLGSATDSDGRTVNVVDDYSFDVSPRSS
jgi:hypothetical protein